MSADTGTRLFIVRAGLEQARLGPDPDAPAARALTDGEVRLAVDRFALTANNITYAAFGEAMQYWAFFPSGDAATGCLPVWGYAEVAESRCAGIEPGRRVWGCWPAGTHAVVRPIRQSARGFVDGTPHRQTQAAVYSQYAFCDADPAWSPHTEGLQAVLQPLFATSFLIDDWLEDNQNFGARQLLLSSASSKTALGTAFCRSLRRGQPGVTGRSDVVGLTSSAHRATTESLGLYDRVLVYDDLETLDATTPTVYIDFAGNAALRRRVHAHFAGTLLFSSSIGGTHWPSLGGARDLPGPRPVLFFAPAQIAQRSQLPPAGWGPGGVQQRLGAAWSAFLQRVEGADPPWVRIVEHDGGDALLATYAALVAGRADSGAGLVIRWGR